MCIEYLAPSASKKVNKLHVAECWCPCSQSLSDGILNPMGKKTNGMKNKRWRKRKQKDETQKQWQWGRNFAACVPHPWKLSTREKEMATLSSILACRILQTEESDGLHSVGSQRFSHDWEHTHINKSKYLFKDNSIWKKKQTNKTEKRVSLSKKKFFFYFFLVALSGEGNGTPLQYSCLENPMDRGAW